MLQKKWHKRNNIHYNYVGTGGASSSISSSGGASSSSLSSFAKQLEDNIIVKSIIEALNNFGEVAPPCPHDPVTGLPNFDAWEELLGLAIKVAAGERQLVQFKSSLTGGFFIYINPPLIGFYNQYKTLQMNYYYIFHLTI